jgi:hypothetical protein
MREQHHTQRTQWGRRAATVAVFLALGFILNLAVAWGSMGGLRAGWLRSLNTTPRVQLGNAVAHSRYIFVYRTDSMMLSQITVQSQYMNTPVDLNEIRRRYARNSGPTYVDAGTIIPRWTGWSLEDVAPDNAPITLPPHAQAMAGNKIPTTLIPTEVNRRFEAFGLPFRSILRSITDPRVILPSSVWLSQFSEVANPDTPVFTFWPPSVSLGGEGYPLRPIWPGAILNSLFYGAILFGLWRAIVVLRRRRRLRRNQCVACAYSLDGIASPACPECGQPNLSTSPLKGRGRSAQPSG